MKEVNIHYYEAEDGTRFENEYECYKYEEAQMLKALGKDVKFFNANYEQVDMEDTSFEYIADNAQFIIIHTEKALEVILELADSCGYRSFDDIYWTGTDVVLAWDDLNENFIDILQQKQDIEEMLKELYK